MRTIAPFSSLGLILLLASPVAAAEWHAGSAALAAGAGDLGAKARDHVDTRTDLGLAGVELGAARVVAGARGGQVVHFPQTVNGVPVLGGGVVVRVDASATVRRVGVDVAKDLVVDTTPTLSESDAHAALVQALGHDVPAPEASALVILRVSGGRLAYHLDVRDVPGGTRYAVDAHDGALLMQRPLAVHALGRVYSENSMDTPIPVDVTLPLLTESADPVRLNGWSGNFSVTNYVSGGSMSSFTVEQTLQPSAGSDFLYDPPAQASDPTDAFAQVNLYYHLSAMRQYFELLGLSFTGASFKLTAVANAQESGQPLDNAFYSPMGITGPFAAPNLIAIGQGTQNDFAYDSDVFNHEFGHYVTGVEIGYNLGQANFDNLGLSPWSGSIDEGIADYFACSKADDAELGEASLGPIGGLRDLTDTSKVCPDDMLAEVHEDGELVGSFAWSLRTELGATIADQLVWGALASLSPGASFEDFRAGIVATAEDLEAAGDIDAADLTTIDGLIAERGLDNCGRIISLEVGDTSPATILGLDLLGAAFGANCDTVKGFGVAVPSLFHYSFTPASGDTAIKFTADMTPQGGGDVEYTIFARANQPVEFSPGAGGFIPEVSDFDYSIAITSDLGELVIDASSDPPFDPTATYDFVISSTSCPTLGMVASVGPYTPPPPAEGGGGAGGGGTGGDTGTGGNGADGDDEEDDGCGCKLATEQGSSSGAPWLGLAALALLGIGRRRRRR